MAMVQLLSIFFFFNDPAPPEISTLSLHDALPICLESHLSPKSTTTYWPSLEVIRRSTPPARSRRFLAKLVASCGANSPPMSAARSREMKRSEEHTSELQSQSNLVCRLLLEKKKNI